jgi:tetratricopeptide (TPR) repeat protein
MKTLFLSILILLFTYPLTYAEQTQLSQEAINHFHDKARQLKDEGKYEEAKVIFKQILAIQPENPNAHFDLGNVYLYQSKYAEAINLYEEAIKLGLRDEHMLTYHFNLSTCYIGLGRNKEAIYHLKQCLKINPDYTEAKNLLEMTEDAYKNNERLKIETED